MFNEDGLKSGLKTHRFGKKIYTFETIDSTNNCARAIAACGAPEGTTIITEEQTAGKGRMGREWITKRGENLMFSVVLRPSVPPERLNIIPFYTANAVAAAVDAVTGLKVDCKWPNDLLMGGKKFSGILIEGSVKKNTVEYIVIGIGINVNQRVFPDSLAEKATSLVLETGREIDRSRLFREILLVLETDYNRLPWEGRDSVLSSWLSRTTMLNKPVSVVQHGETVTGVMRGLSEEGGLVVDTNGVERVFFAGDSSVLRV